MITNNCCGITYAVVGAVGFCATALSFNNITTIYKCGMDIGVVTITTVALAALSFATVAAGAILTKPKKA